MKKVFTCLCVASSIAAHAQITLNQSSFGSSYVGTDSARISSSTATLPNFAPATNANWDLTGMAYDMSGYSLVFRNAISSNAFPGGTQADSMYYPINAQVGGYEFGWVSGVTSNGFEYFGERIFRQPISLSSLTMSPTDSIVFHEQNVVYSSPRQVIAFPATMGSTWGKTFNYTTNFSLTVAAYSINNAPCQRKTYVTYTDTVKGWGTMKVNGFNGTSASGNMNVLMVKHSEIQVDSFFLNGAPAPAQLLSAFGLTQGQSIETNTVGFYRAGELMPLANVVYLNSSFAQSQIDYVEVHTQRLSSPTSIATVSKYGKVGIFPNPLKGNVLTVSIEDKSVRALQYDIININGQVVAKGNLDMNSGNGYINLSNSPANGIYYVRLYEAGALLTTLPLSTN